MKNKNENLTFVFDVDDTICHTNNREYKNSVPDAEVIEKINKLYDSGNKIVLYTSRGMVSCDGDIEKAIEKNESILKEWLKENNVKYSELVFGKPIADFYIDDRCMNVKGFKESELEEFNTGKSGKKVYRFGEYVLKFADFHKRASMKNFEKFKPKDIKSQKIISSLYDKMYLEYVDGKPLIDLVANGNYDLFSKLFFKDINKLKNKDNFAIGIDIEDLFHKLDLNVNNDKEEYYELNDVKLVDKAKRLIRSVSGTLYENKSMSHGDMIMSNILYSKDGLVYLDSEFNIFCSTYIMDLAKMYMSFLGYENIFGISDKKISKSYIKRYYKDVKVRYGKKVAFAMVALTYHYIVRLIRYNKDQLQNVNKLIAILEEYNGKQIKELLGK